MTNNNLQDQLMEFWDTYKDKVGLGKFSDELTRFVQELLTKKDQEKIEYGEKMENYGLGLGYKKGYNKAKQKSDQEHKAELEMIKGEIESKLSNCKGNFYCEECKLDSQEEYNKTLLEFITILDSHINKLSTE